MKVVNESYTTAIAPVADERDKAKKMQVTSRAKKVREKGLAPLKKARDANSKSRRRMEKATRVQLNHTVVRVHRTAPRRTTCKQG